MLFIVGKQQPNKEIMEARVCVCVHTLILVFFLYSLKLIYDILLITSGIGMEDLFLLNKIL